MPAICDLARSYDIAVIEDCAQAHGARINGQSVGTFGDVAAWSFVYKILTTAGEGGMVTTARPDLWDAMWALKDHGKTHDAAFARAPWLRRLHERFGLTSASLSCRVLSVAFSSGAFRVTATCTRNALMLVEALCDLSAVRVPPPPDHLTHAWYKFYAFVQSEALADGWNRDRILSEIGALGYPFYRVAVAKFILRSASRMLA